jgi:hypothetical protein
MQNGLRNGYLFCNRFAFHSGITQFEAPTATELQKLEEKSLIVYIMIGKTQESSDKCNDIPVQFNLNYVPLHPIQGQL